MLSQSQINNSADIVSELNKFGITNKYAQSGILAAIWKETLIQPISENLNYTSAARLVRVYPSKFPNEASAIPYLRNPQKLGDYVYGGKYGNAANEGYLYRGKGYNGLTFKSNYQYYGNKIGVDLVNHPDKANEPAIAAKIIAAYYSDLYKKNANKIQAKYNSTPDKFNNLDSAVGAAVDATAGFPSSWNATVKEGFAKASGVAPSIYALDFIKKNPGTVIVGVLFLVGIAASVAYYALNKSTINSDFQIGV